MPPASFHTVLVCHVCLFFVVEPGPYGTVDRFDAAPSLDGSTSEADVESGYFERSISLFR